MRGPGIRRSTTSRRSFRAPSCSCAVTRLGHSAMRASATTRAFKASHSWPATPPTRPMASSASATSLPRKRSSSEVDGTTSATRISLRTPSASSARSHASASSSDEALARVSPCLKPTLPRRLPPTHAAISTSPTTTKAGCDAAYAADIVACQVKYPNSALKRKQCYELAVVEYAACLAEATGVSPAEVNDRYLWRRLVRAAA